jgi:alkylation response protein AidB-like acyl-CoA dehydrogenase
MDFELTEEQTLLKATLSQFLAHRYDFAARTSASRSEPGYRAEIWQDLAGTLGLLGATLAEASGGMGGGAAEQMIIMEEAGRALLLEPLAETLFQGAWLLERCGATDLLPGVMAGTVRLAVAITEPAMRHDYADVAATAEHSGAGWRLSGQKAVVMAAPWATHLIVAARSGSAHGLSLFVVPSDAPGLTLHPYPTIDGRRAADMVLAGAEGTLIGEEGTALDLLEELRDRAIAAQAAEAAGLLDKLVKDTVDYTKQRQQFGQAISGFQVLQHRMVDMHIHVEMTRSAAVLAALKLNGDPMERALAASAAKVTLANACRFVGQNAVQLHGGMGMTDELSIGHYFKRATVLESEFGSADWHLARHAALSIKRAA